MCKYECVVAVGPVVTLQIQKIYQEAADSDSKSLSFCPILSKHSRVKNWGSYESKSKA